MPEDYSGSYTRGEWDSVVSVLRDKVPFVDAGEVNADTVRTDDATYNDSVTYPDGTTVTTSPSGGSWTLGIASASDTDGTTALSLSVSNLAAYDEYRIRFSAHNMGSTQDVVIMRFNGASTSDYFETVEGSSITTRVSETEFEMFSRSDAGGRGFTWEGRINDRPTNPTVVGDGMGRRESDNVLQRGFLNQSTNITSIDISSATTGEGTLTVDGRNV